MSTKIYNGFKIRALNLKELDAFVKELTKMAQDMFLEEWNKDFALRVCDLIDNLILLDNKKDFDSITKMLEHYSLQNRSIKRLVNHARMGKDFSEIYHPNLLKEYKYTTVNRLIHNIKEENVLSGMNNPTIMDDYIHASIVLFPLTKKITLFMSFSDEFTNLIWKICKDEKYKEFCEKYSLKEYHYQNQSDRPDDISAVQWNKRKKDWDKVNPTIPSKDGIVVNLMDANKFLTDIFFHVPELTVYKTPEDRAKRKAYDEVFQQYCDAMTIECSSFSKVSNATRKFKALLDDENSDWTKKKAEKVSEIVKHLPNITAEILTTNVLDFVPNWKSYMENKADYDYKMEDIER